jgi:glycosyltransferase involved in cell wall biosynthesis
MIDAERLVVLAPIAPAATGNGLAMRAELFRRSAPAHVEVQTIVVPVAGGLGDPPPGDVVLVSPDPSSARAGTISLAADAGWSARLARAEPLPPPSRIASPGLVDEVVRAVGEGGRVAVHVVRSYMAPLGAAVRDRLGARWATLDLDEDDAAFASAFGDPETASAYERLLAVFAPSFDGLAAASAREAAMIGCRHGLVVEQLPNAVRIPAGPPPARDRASGGGPPSLLFVGNLTYQPNVDAAHLLVERILPAIRRRLARRVRVVLVGSHEGRLDHLRGDDVEVTGFVQDLEPLYASAAVAVVPLRAAGGTRIKLLEAFAHGLPVVASTAAAAGLEVAHGRHLLIADDCDQAVSSVEAVLTVERLAEQLADEASRLVRERYSLDVVIPVIRSFYERAAESAVSRSQRTSA